MTGHSDAPPKEDWAGEQGRKWLAKLDRFESMIGGIGAALLARADYRAGERVIDIGCGGGGTTIAIARAVAPAEVVGLDISPELIAASIARAAAEGAANARFVCADAATASPEGAPFDRLFSRFGSMFFDDPHAAFANLHRMLRPGGRIDLAVWAPPREVGWLAEMMAVVSRRVPLPQADPRAPGPFAFGDLGYLAEVLAAGGFGSPDVEAWEGLQPIGGAGATPEEAARFVMESLTFVHTIGERDPAAGAAIEADVSALFERHHRVGEGVMMPGKAWLVRAGA